MSELLVKPKTTEEKRMWLDGYLEGQSGPVVALYTRTTTPDDHPEYVSRAWLGVELPIRQSAERYIRSGQVIVESAEAFFALRGAEVSEVVLNYWARFMREEPAGTLIFDKSDGEVAYLSVPQTRLDNINRFTMQILEGEYHATQ